MIAVTAAEAQRCLPDLLAEAAAGTEVEIHADNGRSFRIIPNRPRPPVTGIPRAGSCQGLIELADDFDAPLEDLREYWE